MENPSAAAAKSDTGEKNPTQRSAAWGLERVMGVEPTYQPWEGRILPMNYTRIACYYNSERNPIRQ